MEGKTRSQTKARLVVLAVFLMGFVAGGLSVNLYKTARSGEPPPRGERGPGGWKGRRPPQERIVEEMTQRLNLSAEQQEKIKAILDETFQQYDEIRAKVDPQFLAVRHQSRERIKAVVTAEQLPALQKMFDESDARWQKRHEKKK